MALWSANFRKLAKDYGSAAINTYAVVYNFISNDLQYRGDK